MEIKRVSPLKAGFSMLEMLIVIAIVSILFVVIIAFLNPKKQLEKAWDSQRHQQLAILQRVLEDYYNDKNEFPAGNAVCYDTPVDDGSGTCSCHVCGLANEGSTPSLANKFCDPEFSKKKYLYQYDCVGASNWYRLCAQLSDSINTYNFGVSSSNISADVCSSITTLGTGVSPPVVPSTPLSSPTPTTILVFPTSGGVTPTNTVVPVASVTPGGPTLTSTPTVTPSLTPVPCPADPGSKYCYAGDVCNNCGTRANCNIVCDKPLQLYSSFGCLNACF